MAAPSLERMGEITCQVWELALAGLPANGGAVRHAAELDPVQSELRESTPKPSAAR